MYKLIYLGIFDYCQRDLTIISFSDYYREISVFTIINAILTVKELGGFRLTTLKEDI